MPTPMAPAHGGWPMAPWGRQSPALAGSLTKPQWQGSSWIPRKAIADSERKADPGRRDPWHGGRRSLRLRWRLANDRKTTIQFIVFAHPTLTGSLNNLFVAMDSRK